MHKESAHSAQGIVYITELVDENDGVHMMIPKAIFTTKR
jgi:acetamidase/formamidase